MIRAVTLGLSLAHGSLEDTTALATRFATQAQRLATDAGAPVRTLRFTLPPLGPEHENRAAIGSLMGTASRLAEASGLRWFCLPLDFGVPGPRKERLAAVLAGLQAHRRMFVNCMIERDSGVHGEAVHDVARLILDVSRQSNNGFDNFRVGASSQCPPHAPFFPASRHVGEAPAFSFALETTPVALASLRGLDARATLTERRDALVASLAETLGTAEALGLALERESGVAYKGLDASFAPFPDGSASVAALVEAFGGSPVGSAGTLFVTAALTDLLRAALRRSGATPAGYNGVMYSILEDDRLAAENARRRLSIDALLSYAAVCGCGLDMLPLPGAAAPEDIAALILDVAGLSTRLKKPLALRVLPVPGKAVNEFTAYNLDFLCDSRVMDLQHVERPPLRSGPWRDLA